MSETHSQSHVPTVPQILTDLVVTATEAAGHGEVLESVEPAVPTRNPSHGDYQSNHAFRVGRALKTNPRAVAEAVVAVLPEHPAVERVEVAGPGFVNFFLSEAWLADHLAGMVGAQACGVVQGGAGTTVVIDYSSPNVAKRMHVGHMRSTIIGDALARIHRAAGWRVVADNHIGDWGTQFGKLIVAWREWLDEAAFEADPIGELERLYVSFGEQATDSMEAQARAETAKLQAGDPGNRALWERFIQVSMTEFERVYDRLDVHFDETLGESAYNEALAGV
ncbi:MAG: arginine--tRNA ligase, partial [Myxococcota bacterium]|nr:arginine--tRNA ligase [Myxococcota bacterium]